MGLWGWGVVISEVGDVSDEGWIFKGIDKMVLCVSASGCGMVARV
jgi:hypothetical protein